MSVWQRTIAAIILQNIDLQIKNFYDPFKDDQFGGRVSEIAIAIFDIVLPFRPSFN